MQEKLHFQRVFPFTLGLAASVKVRLLDGFNFQLFEGRTVTLSCVDNTITETLTMWYKNNEPINNATARNLTLTLKNTDTGFYKCGISGINSSNDFNVTVKGKNLRFF